MRKAIGEAHRRYARMINFREDWRGYLWQGRFHSFVMDESYLPAAGQINKVKEATCLHAKELKINGNTSSYIQADGELIGKGDFCITLIPKAIQFII